MKRLIEVKRVGPRAHVQALLEQRCDHLAGKLRHLPEEAITLHAFFEENGRRSLCRLALSCHVPGHIVAAHEEGRDPGTVIRAGFAELERQLEKQKAAARRARLVRRARLAALWLAGSALLAPAAESAESDAAGLSPRAAEAVRQVESEDSYQRQIGFLRLEALRETGTLPIVQHYLADRDPDIRAASLRALAAIQGREAIPALVAALGDGHPRVRRAALLALEPLRDTDPSIAPALIWALRDRKTEVRMTAADIVSRIPSEEARAAIRTRVRRERDPDVRRVLALAVRRIGT